MRRILTSTRILTSIKCNYRFASSWVNIPLAPPDMILGLSEDFNKDTHPKKVSLGVGAYR